MGAAPVATHTKKDRDLFHRPQFGLRAQLLAMALVAILPGFAVMFWHFESEWEHTITKAQLRSKVVADGVTRDLWSVFRDHREVVGDLALQPQIQAMDGTRCGALLREYVSVYRAIGAVSLRDVKGNVLCSSNPAVVQHVDSDQIRLVTNPVESGGFTISGVEFGQGRQKWVVALAFPVRDTWRSRFRRRTCWRRSTR